MGPPGGIFCSFLFISWFATLAEGRRCLSPQQEDRPPLSLPHAPAAHLLIPRRPTVQPHKGFPCSFTPKEGPPSFVSFSFSRRVRSRGRESVKGSALNGLRAG